MSLNCFKSIAIILVCSLFIASCISVNEQTPISAFSPTTNIDTPTPITQPFGRILFSSFREGESELYIYDFATSDLTRLTYEAERIKHPSWSPDGNKIAFAREFQRGFDVFIMAEDGSSITQITDSNWLYTEPDWSSDGQKIVFTSTRDSFVDDLLGYVTVFSLYIIDISDDEIFRLTLDDEFATNPSWSPGGGVIAFRSNRDGNSEIYLINSDGTGARNLSNHPAEDTHPSISPDGRKILFVSDRDGNEEIYLMNLDGSNQIRLTRHPDRDMSPDWSPDGQFIVFSSNRCGNFDIYIMKADGSSIRQMTFDPNFDGYPDWHH